MRFLLILLAIYFLYRVFFHMILPMVARHFVQKAAQTMSQQQQASQRKEGEVRIETPGGSRDEGEYVDYTEIR